MSGPIAHELGGADPNPPRARADAKASLAGSGATTETDEWPIN